MITSNMKYSFVTHILKPALIMTCLFVLTSVTAMAQAPCAPVDKSAPSDPALQIFELEGKIQSFNRTTRTITSQLVSVANDKCSILRTDSAA